MRIRLLAVLFTILWAALTPAFAVSEKAGEEPYTYADPEGRFSLRLSGDWIKLRADADKAIAGSFLLTKDVDGSRKVVADLMISFVELKASVSFDDYVQSEDRRATNTPGFRKIGRQEKATLDDKPALRNCYSFSRQSGPEELRHRVVCQYYALKDKTIWGITISALKQDEPTLTEVEQLVVSSFQFSVPEGSQPVSLEVFKKVTVAGPMGGFSLTVPEAWEAKQDDEQGAFVRGPKAVVSAFALPRQEQASAEDEAGSFLKERENLKELRVLSQGVGELGPAKGYAVEYSGTAKGRRWNVRLVALVNGEKVFFLHCVVPEEAWSRNREVLRRIEQSFSVETPTLKTEEGE